MLQLRQPDGRQQLEQPVPGVLRVCCNAISLLPSALDIELLSDDSSPPVMRLTAIYFTSVGIFLLRAEQLPYQAVMRSISILLSLSRLQTAAKLADGVK